MAKVQAIAFRNRLPVIDPGAAQGVYPQLDFGAANGVHIDDIAKIVNIGA